MEDILKRMLEIEAQGEALIKKAEEDAQKLRDDNQRAILEEKAAYDAETRAMCDKLIADQVAEKQAALAAASNNSQSAEQRRGEDFKARISGAEDEIFRKISAL